MNEKNDVAAIMAILFAKEILHKSRFLDNCKLLDKKLNLQRTPTRNISYYHYYINLVRHTNCYPCLGWKFLTHFFTVVYTGPK